VKDDELKKAENAAIAARATYEATKEQLQALWYTPSFVVLVVLRCVVLYLCLA
jgi:hypothetical protein